MMVEINTGLHYPIKLNELPSSWVVAFVGDFCDSIQSGFACGQHSDSDIGVPHLRPMNISREGVLDFDVVKYVPSHFNARRLCEDDVLFNNTNSPELIGKTAHITQQGEGLAFSNHMTRLRLHRGVNPRFGAYQLHFLWMARYFLHGCVKHVNQASISASELAKSVPFVAPPVPEQDRIVAKIEELFSELDEGIENLKSARVKLKVYRQAMLKHAFEGKLTMQWRAENQDKLETADVLLKRIEQERAQRYQQQLADWEASGKQGSKLKAPKPLPPLTAEEQAELPELPEGWGWGKAEEVCSSVRDGTHDTPKYADRGIPLVTSKNLRDGKIDFSDTQFISEEDHKSISVRSAVDRGDVLYAMIGTIGNPVVVSGAKVFSIKNVALFKGNPQFLDSAFLSYWLGCAVCDRVLSVLELLKGTTQKFIPLGNLRILPVPICSLIEQQQIVLILSCRVSEVDQLDQAIANSLQQAEALRQSILKKAFSGQLVPQDPHDEPASALLARIHAEQYKSAIPKSKGKMA